MTPTSILTLADLADLPKAKLVLPVPLRIGDRVRLAFRLRRQHGKRIEVLDVSGEYRVSAVCVSAEHQHLSVESVGKAPAWRAIKNSASSARRVAPARFAPTRVL